MNIKDVKPNQGQVDVVAEVISKEEPRSFEKFGKKGKVCNAKIKDTTGEISLTLWNEDIERVNEGDKIHLENGWCSEFKGEKQLTTGKFGKIEVVGTGLKKEETTAKKAAPSKKGVSDKVSDKKEPLFTNDPELLVHPDEEPDGSDVEEEEFEE